MKNRLVSSVGLSAAVLALAVAGCGGGDDSSTTTGASGTPTKEEFLTEGNAICAAASKPIDEKVQTLNTGQPLTEAQINGLAPVVIPSVQGQIDGLRELPAPEGDEETVAALIDAAQEELDKIEDDPSLLASDDTDPFENANQLANDYGLSECGG